MFFNGIFASAEGMSIDLIRYFNGEEVSNEGFYFVFDIFGRIGEKYRRIENGR